MSMSRKRDDVDLDARLLSLVGEEGNREENKGRKARREGALLRKN